MSYFEFQSGQWTPTEDKLQWKDSESLHDVMNRNGYYGAPCHVLGNEHGFLVEVFGTRSDVSVQPDHPYIVSFMICSQATMFFVADALVLIELLQKLSGVCIAEVFSAEATERENEVIRAIERGERKAF